MFNLLNELKEIFNTLVTHKIIECHFWQKVPSMREDSFWNMKITLLMNEKSNWEKLKTPYIKEMVVCIIPLSRKTLVNQSSMLFTSDVANLIIKLSIIHRRFYLILGTIEEERREATTTSVAWWLAMWLAPSILGIIAAVALNVECCPRPPRPRPGKALTKLSALTKLTKLSAFLYTQYGL